MKNFHERKKRVRVRTLSMRSAFPIQTTKIVIQTDYEVHKGRTRESTNYEQSLYGSFLPQTEQNMLGNKELLQFRGAREENGVK